MNFSFHSFSPPVPVYHFLGGRGGAGGGGGGWGGGGGGSTFGWPLAATIHRFRPRSHSIFSFCMDPLTNDGGPMCYLRLSKIGPPMGPHR